MRLKCDIFHILQRKFSHNINGNGGKWYFACNKRQQAVHTAHLRWNLSRGKQELVYVFTPSISWHVLQGRTDLLKKCISINFKMLLIYATHAVDDCIQDTIRKLFARIKCVSCVYVSVWVCLLVPGICSRSRIEYYYMLEDRDYHMHST